MSYYVGIDLGTTNSAICTFDGENVRVWKSPDQYDVTPSVIFINKRGNRYYGKRAYDNASRQPGNCAKLFKRLMGTSAVMEFKESGVTMTPEECSSEILKVMYDYLPAEIRDENPPVVITVPAAFNQMKKNATLDAARRAGFGKVSLMQEPVAAVMSIMRQSKKEGIFLVYDLGGGTFDVSIAENIGQKVSLLAHDGKEMCGGRDLDRDIFNSIVVPWLRKEFNLPDDFLVSQKYKRLVNCAMWAAENAKIELTANEDAVISLSEAEVGLTDDDGAEIYLDIPVAREQVNELICDLIDDTVVYSREAMKKAGLSPNDIERIVFVGGPTNYKPLRDKVAFELSLPADININPMTAVAEGASIFAESVDWDSEEHTLKKSGAELCTGIDVKFNYTARVSSDSGRVTINTNNISGYEIELLSLDSGWTTGRFQLTDNKSVELPLIKNGGNRFAVHIYNRQGQELPLEDDTIVITKIIASVGAIASKSIAVEALNRVGGIAVLDYLVKEGDSLPKKGVKKFKTLETIKAGSKSSVSIKIWEGNIESPVEDNHFVGLFRLSGFDFDSGVIASGQEIICNYEIKDSGVLLMEVDVPAIHVTFNTHNFYTSSSAKDETLDIKKIADSGKSVMDRIDSMKQAVDDDRFDQVRKKSRKAVEINMDSIGEEEILKASTELLEAKKIIYEIRKDHLTELRQNELDEVLNLYNSQIKKYAEQSDDDDFVRQCQTAQKAIDKKDPDFESILRGIYGKLAGILSRQDWYVVMIFNKWKNKPYDFADRNRFNDLCDKGSKCINNDDINGLRRVLDEMHDLQLLNSDDSVEDMFESAKIIKF